MVGCSEIKKEALFPPPSSPTTFRVFTRDKENKETQLQPVNNKYQYTSEDKVVIRVEHKGPYCRHLRAALFLNKSNIKKRRRASSPKSS